jgi:hypothetical protein
MPPTSRVVPFTPQSHSPETVYERCAHRRTWKTLTTEQQAAVIALMNRFSALNAQASPVIDAARRAIPSLVLLA